MARALTTTQAVVLKTLADPSKADGWYQGELHREIPGIKFNRNTLAHLHDLGLAEEPNEELGGWTITEDGRLLLAEMGMNADSRLFSWERKP